MTAEVAGVPELLEAYSAATLAALEDVRAALVTYRRTIEELSAAPSDLPVDVDDVGGAVELASRDLGEIDRVPAAFAAALRALDAAPVQGPAVVRSTDRENAFELLLARHLADGAQVGPVRDGVRVPPASDASGLDPWFWSGLAVGLPLDAVNAADRLLTVPVSGYWRGETWVEGRTRWRPGTASTMNRVASADTVARWAPVARRAGPAASVALPTLEQIAADQGDPEVTTGQRITRTGSAAALEGGLGVAGGAAGFWAGAKAGAWAGGLGGTAAAPGIGTAIGAVGGGLVGGIGGSWVGSKARDAAGGAIDWMGDRLDGLLGTGEPAGEGGRSR